MRSKHEIDFESDTASNWRRSVAGVAGPFCGETPFFDLTPSFDTCEALSVERGAGPQQGGNTVNPYIQYNAFMRACLDGKIPLSDVTDALGQFRRTHQGD